MSDVDRLDARLRDSFWSKGFVRVPNALTEQRCDEIVEAMWRRHAEAGTEGADSFTEFAVWRYDQCFRDVMDNPHVVGLAVDLMGEDIQLMSAQHMIRWPGRKQEFWHTDGAAVAGLGFGYPPVIPSQALMQLKITYALHDLSDPRSGITLAVPGSHRLPNNGVNEYVRSGTTPDDAVPMTMAKGDAIIFHQAVWHSAGHVESDDPRLVLFYAYNHVWSHPYDFAHDDVDPRLYEQLNPVQQRLLKPFHNVEKRTIGRWYQAPRPSLRTLLGMGP
jgi:ectoine hydroxylase